MILSMKHMQHPPADEFTRKPFVEKRLFNHCSTAATVIQLCSLRQRGIAGSMKQ